MRQVVLIVLCGIVTLSALAGGLYESTALASAVNLGLSPQDQKKYDEAIQSARSSQSVAEWCFRAVFILIAGMCFYGAYSAVRHGFSITRSKRQEGPAAWAVAILAALVGVAILIGGWI